jgi:branched-chain amino acid transport system permease protein
MSSLNPKFSPPKFLPPKFPHPKIPPTRQTIAAVLVVAGFLTPRLLGGSPLVYNTFVTIAVFSAMSYGLDVVLSDLGEISLFHTAFFAAGAYAAAILTVRYGFNAWVALAGAVAAALLLALVLGVITLRAGVLPRHYAAPSA